MTRNHAFNDVVITQPTHVDQVDGLIAQSLTRITTHLTGWAHSLKYGMPASLLVGHGVRINHFFAGESMFHHATDAQSRTCSSRRLAQEHRGQLLDVQWTTEHLVSLGAIDIARTDYLRTAKDAVSPNSRKNDDETS